jgi:hypothetical protein
MLCAAMLVTAVGATTGTKTLKVAYKDIKLVVDGVAVTPKDVNGTVVEPFVYNGTTYLPARALASALGKSVNYDGKTHTVYIGKVPGKNTYLQPYEVSGTTYDGTNASRHFSMMGVKYTNGIRLSGWFGDHNYALYNTNGQYSKMTITYGHVDNESTSAGTLYIYADGQSIKEIPMKGDMLTQTVTIPLNDALQVKFQVDTGESNGTYGIANVTVS